MLRSVQDDAPRLASRTVGVIGSGSAAHPELAEPLGRLLAHLGVNLLTGGGRGVMEAVARAFVTAAPHCGISIGVLPCDESDATRLPEGYPNDYVQFAVVTHLPDRGRRGHLPSSRNHVIVLSSDVIVALPGSHGTESELRLALDYHKPTVAYCSSLSSVGHFPAGITRVTSVADVESFLRSALKF
ncbi:MAG TPA: hypothetical protein VFZ56_05255 [Gemmatimonadaceae bacterium]